MPRFYSPEWVEAFNKAVAGLAGTEGAGTAGRDFRLAQIVRNAPPEVAGTGSGALRIVLEVEGARMVLRRGSAEDEEADPADVTVLVDYDDAVALSTGALDPPGALGAGRIRVRGDLSVLVSGQALLSAVAPRLAELRAATTY